MRSYTSWGGERIIPYKGEKPFEEAQNRKGKIVVGLGHYNRGQSLIAVTCVRSHVSC